MSKEKSKNLASVSSSALARSASVIGFSLATGRKFAGLKFNQLFRDEKKRHDLASIFLNTQADKLVSELGQLKGSLMKAGQFLSIYGEHFLPSEINDKLKTLQNQSIRVDWPVMEKMLRRSLGEEKLSDLEIDEQAFKAASMGQVHLAKIGPDYQQVALKIQYPGVDKAIESDIKLLRYLLSLSRFLPKEHNFDAVFAEVRSMLHHEVDYKREFKQTLDFYDLLRSDERFVVPKPIEQLSSSRTMATVYEPGLDIDSPEVANLSQKRRNLLGIAFMDLMWREIFSFRQVQTDAHLGNYAIRLDPAGERDQIILYDFGACRKLPKDFVRHYARMMFCNLHGIEDILIQEAQQMGYLNVDDHPQIEETFLQLCRLARQPFGKNYASPAFDGHGQGFDWSQEGFFAEAVSLGRKAAKQTRLRPPPRETVFLDRKIGGVFTILSKLKVNFGAYHMIMKYLEKENLIPGHLKQLGGIYV